MTLLVNNQPLTIAVGQTDLGPLTLPVGAKNLLCTYANAGWPEPSDGAITVTLRLSNDSGATYRDEWHDTFQHVALRRGGALQSTAVFGIGLSTPFGPTSRLIVRFNSTVSVSTTVSVDAS